MSVRHPVLAPLINDSNVWTVRTAVESRATETTL